MKALTCAEMRSLEADAIAAGWSEERLLDAAGTRLGHALGRHFPQPGTAIACLGKGHNAGDALVALRVLRDLYGWRIALRPAFPMNECAPLTGRKWQELGKLETFHTQPPWQDLQGPLLLLDALVGIGSSGPLREPLAALAVEMEWLRQHAAARLAAVDLPSGVDPDSGIACAGAVTADATFMIGCAKRGLLLGHAANSTGTLALVPLEPLSTTETGEIALICPQEMHFGKAPRPFDFHKGLAGHVAVVAGSDRYPGAAVLAATGALRGGAGLVTLHVPHSAAAIIAAKCPPEIIIHSYSSPRELCDRSFDALVIGCGLGEPAPADAAAILDWLTGVSAPAVIDADALNLIARSGRLDLFNSRHVLTPHPGEFRRLAPDLAALPREQSARGFVERVPATLLLKGGRTLVTRQGAPLWCNATGSPGMASGGQGDLLAGVIGALLVSGESPTHAAALAAWVCGRAAEIALDQPTSSVQSLSASDTALQIGAAFRDWCAARR
jgi:NAD(P)H-hydrate epimerase